MQIHRLIKFHVSSILATNVTMEAGDMVLYESHSVVRRIRLLLQASLFILKF